MKKKLLFAAAMLLAAVGVNAQTDVTSTYLTNADFSSTDGWTANVPSSTYYAIGNGLIGTFDNYSGVATVDDTHLDTEYCFGFECRWQTNFANYTQTTSEQPAGVYTLTFDVENVNGGTTSANYENRFYVQIGDKTITDSSTEWMRSKSSWTTHTISYTLDEPSAVTISLGYGTGSNNIGSGGTPRLYVSHLKLTYTDPEAAEKEAALKAAKYALNGYIKKATALNAVLNDETLASAIETAQGVFANADDYAEDYENTVDESTTLNAAITTATSKITEISLANGNFDTDINIAVDGSLRKDADDNEITFIEPATEAKSYVWPVTDWTQNFKFNSTAAQGTTAEYGATISGDKGNNGTNPPATDMFGGNVGGALHLSAGWGDIARYQQTINLQAGKYIIYYEAYNANSAATTINANYFGIDGNYASATSYPYNEWTPVAEEIDLTASNAEAVISVGLTSTTSGSATGPKLWIDNVKVYQLEVNAIADEVDYQELAAAIAKTEGIVLGFDKDEYAPYNNIEAINALTKAQEINQAAENMKEYVTEATAALTAATWTANTEEVNAIYDGVFANTEANTTSGDINLPGWKKEQGIRLLVKDLETDPGLAYTDGQAAVFSWGGTTITYGEQTGYTLPLKKNQVYELSFKISGWRDGDYPNVVTATLDGVSYSLNPSQFVKPINVSEGNPFKEVKFYLTPVNENSILNIYANHHFAVADLKLMKVAGNLAINEAQSYDIMQAGLIDVELTRTIKEGVNSVVLPFELNADDIAELGGTGAVAYTVSDYDAEKESLKLAEAESVPANTPFFLKATAAGSSFVFNEKTIVAGEPTTKVGDATLVGTYAKIDKVPEGSYILSGGKFYLVNSTVSLKSTRAYVTVPASAGAKSVLNVEVDDATAIVGVESETVNGEVYDIAGRKVSAPVRGLYIANGKKVLVK